MHEMEGNVRSAVVQKRKGSSGCLIIKNKVEDANSAGGVKRGRLVASSSSDEDESLEYLRRKVYGKRMTNGITGNKMDESGNREFDPGDAVGDEKERSRLDLFEFDEYDDFDEKSVRNKFLHDSFKKVKETDIGCSNRKFEVYKRKKQPCFDGSSSRMCKGSLSSLIGSKQYESDDDDDEADMPISLLRLKYQQTPQEPIRLQGKNGVLKVMVNKKKTDDIQSQRRNYDRGDTKERKGSISEGVVKDSVAQMPTFLVSKRLKDRISIAKEGVSIQKDNKSKLDKVKSCMKREIKDTDSETDGADTVLKLATPSVPGSSARKSMKKENEQSLPPQIFTPSKSKVGKEGKPNRGGSTEKQILRDKIRGMLVDAGWSIDYRPRRNRDYLDAVYINPNGTAYWSIVKAYDAFKKQLEENSVEVAADTCSTCAPLADELINKLTRQTKKKIEEEKKRKRKETIDSKIDKESAMSESADSSESDQDEERPSSYVKQKNKSLKNNIPKVNDDGDDEQRGDFSLRKSGKSGDEVPTTASKSNVIQGRTSQVIGKCAFQVRGLYEGKHLDSDVPYCGKRTVLAWLIDSGTANLSEKVRYMNRMKTRVMLEGWITKEGIHCGCCSKILTVSKFELHAGSKLRQPFQNIFLESGPSLLQCQIDAWNRQEDSLRQDFHTVDIDGDDPDDDTCNICGDGGDLICCDSCPSTFHQICLGIQMLPSGDWHCPYCICKFCGYYGCSDDAEEEDATGDILQKCIFCEKKYHETCSDGVHYRPLSSSAPSFCSQKCQELHDHLQQILGIKQELEAGFSWSLLQRTDLSDSSHRGFSLRAECNSKLAVALSIMDECFLPIIDRRSGINIIHNVVYNCGSNFNRLNYHGFYTAILERGDEIISAASIRLHGDRLAEMPFIGTREIYRRQGMCRRLLSAIESELRLLKVGQLIIPAISEHMNTWTKVFGFDELEDVHKKEIKSMNMLVFPGTDMLHKQLVKQEILGIDVSKSIKDKPRSPGVVEKSHSDSSVEQNKQEASGSGGFHNSTTEFKDVFEPESSMPAIPSHTEADSAPDAADESDNLHGSQGTTVAKTEVENIQKGLSFALKPNSDSSDMENQLPYPPAADNIDSSVEAVVGNVSECQEASRDSILDASGCILNEDETCIRPVSEPLENSEFAKVEIDSVSSLHLYEDDSSKHSYNATRIDARGDVAGDNTCSSSTYMNDEKCDEPFETSAKDALPSSSGYRNPASISAALVAVDTSETDKPDGVAADSIVAFALGTCSGGETMDPTRTAENNNNSEASDCAYQNME